MIGVQQHLQGQVVDGRYPLLEFLGSTQHSSVFRTEYNEAPNQQAAIKLIPAPAGSSGAQITRWRLASRFSHPALLRIFQMGRCELDGRPMLYVIMECAEENLAEILPVRCLSPGETDAVLRPALDALGYLHGKGFVHGHLRPSNILAIGDQVKLSSDSIARIGEAADPHEPGDPYRAPETSLSAATDIWSLGITLVQCLTGRIPERSPEGRHAVSIPAEVPSPFSELARHCLNPVPQRRWRVAQLQSSLVPGSSVVAPASAPESESVEAPADMSDSAFVKPDAAAPVRRRLHIKKQYRLALAALAAGTAAFVLGIVISGNSTESTVTASAPIVAAASSSQPGRASKSSGGTDPLKPRTQAAREKSNGHIDAPKPDGGSLEPKGKNEKSPLAQLERPASSGPAIIVSKVAPTAATQPLSPISGDVVPGAVSRRALPRVPTSASNTIWGTVRVSVIVDVDPRGRVVEAKLDSAGPSQYFARLSMAAAQDWKFNPPRVDGNIVPSEWEINFGYSKTDTSATAAERHP
jgi:TonB family protein